MHLSLKRTLFIFSLAALMVVLAFAPVRAAINEIVWKKPFENEKESNGGIAVDQNGNVIVAGNQLAGLGGFIRKFSGGGRVLWTRPLEAPGDELGAGDVAVDSDGNIYVVGAADWGDFLSKYGPKGGHHWTRHWTRKFSRNTQAWATGIDVGPGGNIYIVGTVLGALPNMTGSGQVSDAFIRKYNPDGKIFWTRQFNLDDIDEDAEAYDVAVGPGGGVYVVGATGGLNDWGSFENEQYDDGLFLRKYSSRGDVDWTRRVNRRDQYFTAWGSVAVDRAGGVAIIGSYWSGDHDQAVTIKYTHKGERLWTRVWGKHWAGDVTVDRDRNVYTVGSSSSGKAFVRKHSAGGTRLWTRYFARGYVAGAATDSENNLYVTRVPIEWDSDSGASFLAKFRR